MPSRRKAKLQVITFPSYPNDMHLLTAINALKYAFKRVKSEQFTHHFTLKIDVIFFSFFHKFIFTNFKKKDKNILG